ncbi:hypothetical protein IL54_3365 [Sphingobium sp. ba1]|jgi:hypothetical protein|nr:hypothetical protein IL54_3365 [Sphingobium sp. ba1]
MTSIVIPIPIRASHPIRLLPGHHPRRFRFCADRGVNEVTDHML